MVQQDAREGAEKTARRRGGWMVGGLVLLNLILAAGVLQRSSAMPAFAQQMNGSHGNYLVVAGHVNNEMMVFALDATTGKMMAIKEGAGGSSVAGTVDVPQDLERAFKNGPR